MKNIGLVVLALMVIGCQSCTSDDNDNETKPGRKPMIVVDKDAALFVNQATTTAIYEIDIDKLAITKGQDKRVKNFGNIMAKEHTKAIAKLTEIANSKKIPVPTTMTPAEQDEINELLKNNGKDFDRAYMDAMAKNHEDVIRIFTQASKQLMDPELRSFAARNIGNLQRHLDAVNMIRGSMK